MMISNLFLKYLKDDKHISLYFGPKCICIFDVYVVYLTLDIICSFELTVFNLENCLHLGNIYILHIYIYMVCPISHFGV